MAPLVRNKGTATHKGKATHTHRHHNLLALVEQRLVPRRRIDNRQPLMRQVNPRPLVHEQPTPVRPSVPQPATITPITPITITITREKTSLNALLNPTAANAAREKRAPARKLEAARPLGDGVVVAPEDGQDSTHCVETREQARAGAEQAHDGRSGSSINPCERLLPRSPCVPLPVLAAPLPAPPPRGYRRPSARLRFG